MSRRTARADSRIIPPPHVGGYEPEDLTAHSLIHEEIFSAAYGFGVAARLRHGAESGTTPRPLGPGRTEENACRRMGSPHGPCAGGLLPGRAIPWKTHTRLCVSRPARRRSRAVSRDGAGSRRRREGV